MFELDSRLSNDTHVITDLPLCRVLLMNDSQFPWLILVPRVDDITEIIELSAEQRAQLWDESDVISRIMQQLFTPDKLNIAALGNVVKQLHLHHVARYKTDVAWPAPVWGKQPVKRYEQAELDALSKRIKRALVSA